MELSQIFDELQALVEIESGSSNIEGVERVQKWIARYLMEKLGAAVSIDWIRSPGKAPICHIKGPRTTSDKPILLCGHADTVYPLDPSAPARIEKVAGNLWKGKGILDMKAGLLMACYLAIEWTVEKSFSWEFVINGDEEIGSPFSKSYLQEIAPRYSLGLVFEPSFEDGSLALSRGASASLRIQATGISAHVGRNFKEGASAIAALCHLCTEIEKTCDETTFVNLGKIEGGSAVNVVSSGALLEGNIRSDCEKKIDHLEETLQSLCSSIMEQRPGIELHCTVQLNRPARRLCERQKKLNHCLDQCAKELGQNLQWKKSAGVCDGNTLSAAGLLVLDNIGAGGFGIHSERETLDPATIIPKLKLLRKLIEKVKEDPLWIGK